MTLATPPPARGGPSARNSLETFDSIHPGEKATRSFLTEERRVLLAVLHRAGNCRDLGPSIFYPQKGESARPAYLICSACVVRIECLTFALRSTERLGVWARPLRSSVEYYAAVWSPVSRPRRWLPASYPRP